MLYQFIVAPSMPKVTSWLFIFIPSIFNLISCDVPVILWESNPMSDKTNLIPSLFQINSREFFRHIIRRIEYSEPLIALFLVKDLCIEDFSRRGSDGKMPFRKLQNLTNKLYKLEFITSVKEPLTAFKAISVNYDYVWTFFKDDYPLTTSKTILEVPLDTVSVDRSEMFRTYDNVISNVYTDLLTRYDKIFGVLTGRLHAWKNQVYKRRIKRDINITMDFENNFHLKVLFPDNTISVVRSREVPTLVLNGAEATILTGKPIVTSKATKETRSILAVFPFQQVTLNFTFAFGDGKWNMTEILLNDDISLESGEKMSEHYGIPFTKLDNVEFTAGTTKLTFKNIYVLGYSSNSGLEKTVYFTWPALTVIFLTVILGIALSFAIILMMDINTPDRFEDPRGKTIFITQNVD